MYNHKIGLVLSPKLETSAVATLTWRENLQRFLQEVNTFDQVSKITTSGWDQKEQKTNTFDITL